MQTEASIQHSAHNGLKPLPIEPRCGAEMVAEQAVEVTEILEAAIQADIDDFLITHS